jgi:DNA helicase-2/ATP-dependent DNA helicase PcrA
MIASGKGLIETKADAEIKECLDSDRSFSVVAGAGSGKTTSLITALDYIREVKGQVLRRDGKRIACITYTNRAVEVISSRLGWDDLFCVSTLHGFLWNEVKRFTPNIRSALQETIIPAYIDKKQANDNGGNSKRALTARAKVKELTEELEQLNKVSQFFYNDNNFSDYPEGKIGHDDVIAISALMISKNELLRRVVGQKYPYIFVDEAQDTFSDVVEALNKLCENEGLPVVGYFGDPMQQIYENRAGDFVGPKGAAFITKEENFRCARQVITLLNAFRKDVQQYPAGKNAEIEGTVEIRLIEAELPEGPRKRYSEEQLIRASERFEETLDYWGWTNQEDVKRLFLVRQMIARRLGFPKLQKLFTGMYASTRAKDDYESGEHVLLKPFINSIWPLVKFHREGNMRKVINVLRESSPAFNPEGVNSGRSIGEMKEMAIDLIVRLAEYWEDGTLGEILNFCQEVNLCKISDRVIDDLARGPMSIEYDKDLYSKEKGSWLADVFFQMTPSEIESFSDFIKDNTPYSTQHGVKGEEYNDVVVVFDDVEAVWNNYSFTKTLTPDTSGKATEGQSIKSTKLAYVCFSRAELNLRIILFTPDPNSAKRELVSNGIFFDEQVTIDKLRI